MAIDGDKITQEKLRQAYIAQLEALATVPHRKEVCRTYRTVHAVEHKGQYFHVCEQKPCCEIELYHRVLIEWEMERIEKWLRADERRRIRFDRICNAGGDPILLFSLLFLIDEIEELKKNRKLETDEWFGSRWKHLPEELVNIANKIQSVTSNELFSQKMTLYWKSTNLNFLPIDTRQQKIRRELNTYQHLVPLLLRQLAKTMREADYYFATMIGRKQLGAKRLLTIQTLAYVRSETRKPHWEDLGVMLNVSPDELRKLWARAKESGLIPTAK